MQKYIPLLLLLTLGLFTCVEPVDFDANEPGDLLVVDGFISPGSSAHYIRLSKTGPLDKRVFDPVSAAKITLFEEGVEAAEYIEIEDGHYELNASDLTGVIGRSYYIAIELNNGKKYESLPEIIPNPVKLDSVSYELVAEEFANDAGNIITKNFVKAFANLIIPETVSGPFLRWKVEEIYLVTEKKCAPLDNALSCYIRPNDVVPGVALFSGTDFTPGLLYRQEVKKRFIDYAFGERCSFSVQQIAHTSAALEYWAKVEQIVALEGSIFDVAPAPIQGNIYNVEDETEQVLGYFSGVAIDTAHLFVTRFDVAPIKAVSPYCGPPEQAWWLSPSECCNCLNLRNSSLERPEFW